MPVLRRYLRKCITVLRYQGPIVLLWRILVKCLSPVGIIELIELYHKDLTGPLKEFRAKVSVSFEQATDSDIPKIAELTATGDGVGLDRIPSIIKDIERAIQRGELCFVARIGSEIAHCNWIAFKSKESFAGRHIVLNDDEAYTRAGHTDDKWRGRGIHSEMNYHMLYFLKNKGYRKAYACVNRDNISSRKMFSRVGWVKMGLVLSFKPRWSNRSLLWLLGGSLGPFAEKGPPQQIGKDHFRVLL